MIMKFVYTFRYSDKEIAKATKRAICSLQSLSVQKGCKAQIYFLNCSKKDIRKELNDLPVEYHYMPLDKIIPMCKSKMINYAARTFINASYFFLSDIDLVYPDNYIESMLNIALKESNKNKKQVRVIPNVYYFQEEYYSGNYNDLLKANIKIIEGSAPGNGLVCADSFGRIRGYNEGFIGWGHEDILFNDMICQSDVKVMAESVKTIHLWHKKSDQKHFESKVNDRLFFIKTKEMKKNILFNNLNWGQLDNKMKISICIPTYEMGGYGVKYLSNLINSIAMQSFKEYEIIISDHSQNNDIEEFCDKITDLPLKYYRYRERYGNGPANTNNSIAFATGKYIKPMFQDDCFLDRDALSILFNLIESQEKKWILCSSNHMDINGNKTNHVMTPTWNPKGKNNIIEYMKDPYIGSPSRAMWLNGFNLLFDENYVHFMDVDMWYRIGNIFNSPIIYKDKELVCCRNWSGSVTSLCGKSHPLDKERDYIFKKYKK